MVPDNIGEIRLLDRAATRAAGLSYSRFISGLTKAGVALNRKALSEIAIADPEGFKALVEQAKAALA